MLKGAYCCAVVLAVLVIVVMMLLSSQEVALDGSPDRSVFLRDYLSTLNATPEGSVPPPSTQPVSLPSLPTVHPTILPKRAIHFSRHEMLKSTNVILGAPWVSTLKKMLDLPGAGKQVVVVFGTSNYLESVLNWLVAATVRLEPPLENVIVFCLDLKIFNALTSRKIPAIFVDPKTVVNVAWVQMQQIWLVRMVVYRLINYLGHDVMAYDSDAIVLRNPQKLLERHQDSDIISSPGTFPPKMGRVWGFTACMGVILVRSSPRTGKNGAVTCSWQKQNMTLITNPSPFPTSPHPMHSPLSPYPGQG